MQAIVDGSPPDAAMGFGPVECGIVCPALILHLQVEVIQQLTGLQVGLSNDVKVGVVATTTAAVVNDDNIQRQS